jgi:hypothetical protein
MTGFSPKSYWTWKVYLHLLYNLEILSHYKKKWKGSIINVRKSSWKILILVRLLTFWHRSFKFNSNKSRTSCNNFQFIILTFVYSSTCFGSFPVHHLELNDCSGSLWFYLRIVVTVVLCSWSGRPAGNLYKRERKARRDLGCVRGFMLLNMGWLCNKESKEIKPLHSSEIQLR